MRWRRRSERSSNGYWGRESVHPGSWVCILATPKPSMPRSIMDEPPRCRPAETAVDGGHRSVRTRLVVSFNHWQWYACRKRKRVDGQAVQAQLLPIINPPPALRTRVGTRAWLEKASALNDSRSTSITD